MSGPWMIASKSINGKRHYRAYRKRHTDRADYPANREYYGQYSSDRSAVEALVEYLNEKETGGGNGGPI